MDDDIGWDDFELRNYDPQIGRWVQQDPYCEFSSPYTGMGNDPMNMIDPSGGWSLAGITGTTNILFNTAVTTLGGALVGGIVGMATGDDNAWLKGAAIGLGVGLGVTFKANINVAFDIFRTGLQIENRIVGRTLNDLSDRLMNTEEELNRRNKKDRDDFKIHFGIDDDKSMDNIKDRVLKEENLVKDYLHKRSYKDKLQHTHDFDNKKDKNGQPARVFAQAKIPYSEHKVGLEKYFWKAPRDGEDSKLGTLAHELSHFLGTHDLGNIPYGVKIAYFNSKYAPAQALISASNFEYYISRVRLK